MADNLKIELSSEGVREFLRSDDMMNVCKELADEIVQRAGGDYQVGTYTGKNRVNAQIDITSYKALRDNHKNNTLLKAMR